MVKTEARLVFQQIALGVGFILVAAAFLIAWRSPATGWELDVYASTPTLFWVLVIASLGIGLAVILVEAMAESPSRLWFLGFLLLIMTNAALVFLPALRGYLYLNTGDSSGHLAFARDIFEWGRFSSVNAYPVTHILMWALARVGNISLEGIARCLPGLFTLLFMASTYLLANDRLKGRQVLLASAASVTLLFYYYHVAVYPNSLAILSYPLLFYLYFRARERAGMGYSLLLFIFLTLNIFFHPNTAVIATAYLAVAEIARGVAHWWQSRRQESLVKGLSFNTALFEGITFLMWMSSVWYFESQIRSFWRFLGGQLFRSAHIGQFASTITGQYIPFWRQVMTGLKVYGDDLIYVSLSVVAAAIIITRLYRRREDMAKPFSLLCLFLVSGPLWLFLMLGSGATTIGRLLGSNPLWWIGPLLVAIALDAWLGWRKNLFLALIPVWGILFAAALIGVLWLYPSPRVMNINWQVTYRDRAVGEWLLHHEDPGYEMMLLGYQPGTRGTFMGIDAQEAADDYRRWYYLQGIGHSHLKPEQLNYRHYSSLGDWAYNRAYIILTDRFRIGSTAPSLSEGLVTSGMLASPGFKEGDFEKLKEDPAVQHLYSSGGSDIFLIRPVYRYPKPLPPLTRGVEP